MTIEKTPLGIILRIAAIFLTLCSVPKFLKSIPSSMWLNSHRNAFQDAVELIGFALLAWWMAAMIDGVRHLAHKVPGHAADSEPRNPS